MLTWWVTAAAVQEKKKETLTWTFTFQSIVPHNYYKGRNFSSCIASIYTNGTCNEIHNSLKLRPKPILPNSHISLLFTIIQCIPWFTYQLLTAIHNTTCYMYNKGHPSQQSSLIMPTLQQCQMTTATGGLYILSKQGEAMRENRGLNGLEDNSLRLKRPDRFWVWCKQGEDTAVLNNHYCLMTISTSAWKNNPKFPSSSVWTLVYMTCTQWTCYVLTQLQ